MKLGLQEIDVRYIGAVLAREDDEAQAEFFSALVQECKYWGTRHQIETQFAAVNRKLSDEEKKILSMITYTEEIK